MRFATTMLTITDTAKNIFHQITDQVKRFEAVLDDEHEVGMKLVSFGQSIQFTVTKLSYMNPSLIWFEGILPEGSHVQLIQHVNQVSFLMIAINRPNPDQAKSPIGFCPDQTTSLELSEPNSTYNQQQQSSVIKE